MSDSTATRTRSSLSPADRLVRDAPDRRYHGRRFRAAGSRGHVRSIVAARRVTTTSRWSRGPRRPGRRPRARPARSRPSPPGSIAAIARRRRRELVAAIGLQRARGLPGDERAARPDQQREPELDQLGQRGQRPARRSPRRAGPTSPPRPGPPRPGRRLPSSVAADDRLEEPGLLADRLDEHRPGEREGRRQRQPREAAAAPEVDERVDPPLLQDARGRSGCRRRGGSRSSAGSRIAVRLIAAFQAMRSRTWPSIVRRASLGRATRRSPRGRPRGRARTRPGGEEGRRRASGAGPADGPGTPPVGRACAGRPGSAPGVVVRHTALGPWSSAAGPVRGRVSPCPSPASVPRRSVRMPDVRGPRRQRQSGLSTNPPDRGRIVDNSRAPRRSRSGAGSRSSRSDGSARRRPLPGGRLIRHRSSSPSRPTAAIARRTIRSSSSTSSSSSARQQRRLDLAGLGLGRSGQDEDERRAGPRHRRDVEVAAHLAGEVAGDRQAETGAHHPLVPDQPLEPLEDPAAILGRDARRRRRGRSRTATSPSTRPAISTLPPSGVNFRAFATRFVRICSTRRRSPVATRIRGGRDGRQARPVVDRDRQQARGDLGAGLGDRERSDLEVDRPRLQPRQLQQVADEVGHRADDRAAPLEEVVLDLRIEDLAAEDQLEVAAQPRERRPQLVGDGRDERRPARRRGPGASRARARWRARS